MILRCLVLIPAFLAILRPTAAFAPYEAPDDCEWNFVNDESGFAGGVSLTCHLSAINSHLEKTNFRDKQCNTKFTFFGFRALCVSTNA